tara:strand:- start:15508 stop:16542 length:1035 start_codon:yes stop_codon:yes gene_type:complete
MSALTDALQGLFGGGAATLLQNDAIQKTEQAGKDALLNARNIADELSTKSAFTPFSVTSGGGTVDTLAQDGRFKSLGLNLPPELQAIVAQMQGAAGDATGRANVDTFQQTLQQMTDAGLTMDGKSEAEIFQMLNAVQQPAQERERLALEERLFNQGRGGVRTAQFGGSPEEFAIAKAREEQRGQTSVDAFNLAGDEEQRRFDQFSGLFDLNQRSQDINARFADSSFTNAFRPTDDLRRTATLGADIGSIDQQARTEGIRNSAGILESGMQSKLGTDQLATQARIARNQDIVDLLLGSEGANGGNGLFGQIADTASDFFGGGGGDGSVSSATDQFIDDYLASIGG